MGFRICGCGVSRVRVEGLRRVQGLGQHLRGVWGFGVGGDEG